METGGNSISTSGYNIFLGFYKIVSSILKPIEKKPDTKNSDIEWDVSHKQLKPGENITITGNTEPDTRINMVVRFNVAVAVHNGRYSYDFHKVQIPEGANEFKVQTKPVKNMTFTVKMLMPFRQHRDAEDSVATYIDTNVPSGTFNINISGDAQENTETVQMDVKASQVIQADPEGNISYTYDTTPFNPGIVEIEIGSDKKEVELIGED
jgi:hypothetical protein